MGYKNIIALLSILLVFTHTSHSESPESKFQIGDVVPNFTAKDQFDHSFDLYQALEEGPVVLMFYRGYWCPYCNKQLSQMEDSLSFISEKGGSVIAVTPESPQGIAKTISKTKASFRIVHDQDFHIMDLFEVRFTLSEQLNQLYQKNGIYVEKNNGSKGPNLPVPATYIIGQNRKILYAFYDPNYKKRATVGKILENL